MTIINNMLTYHPEAADFLVEGQHIDMPGDHEADEAPLGARKPAKVPTRVTVEKVKGGKSKVVVETTDRPGLLVDVVRTLKDLSLNVVSAEIDTVGPKAYDVIYCTYRGEALNKSMHELVVNASHVLPHEAGDRIRREPATIASRRAVRSRVCERLAGLGKPLSSARFPRAVEPFGRMGSVEGGEKRLEAENEGDGRPFVSVAVSRAFERQRAREVPARACMYYTHPAPEGTGRGPNVRTTRPSKTHSLSVGTCRSVGARAGSTVPPPKVVTKGQREEETGVGSVVPRGKHPPCGERLINARVGDRAGACLVTLASSY